MWIQHPAPQRVGGVRESACGDRLTAGKMGEIGADAGACFGPAHAVAKRAGFVEERLPPFERERFLR